MVEIKDEGEIAEPLTGNVKKHEFATAHFAQLNKWLEKENLWTRYQFNMLTPQDYGKFFTKLRKRDLVGFRSELDVVMARMSK